jgi:DNA-binding transcriptional LysR family regulator
MPLESLKVFCDLAGLRSVSKAAKANGLSQPTATRVVRQLESRLGGELINRSTRPLQLTPLGQRYYDGCKQLLDRYLELEASLRRGPAEAALTIRVVAIYSVGLWDMNQYIDRFADQFPHARVRIEYLHPDKVYERVLNGTADLGLVSFPNRMKELTVLPWREEEMVLACAPGHPLARNGGVRPQRLDGVKFVAFDRGLIIRRKVDEFLREQDVEVDVSMEFDNIENIKKGIEAGAGVGILPEPMLRAEVKAGTLKAIRLEGCWLKRPLGIIHRRHHPLNNAAKGFVGLLRANGSNHLANGKASK